MIAWILQWFRRAPPSCPVYYSEEIEAHLRDLGLSAYAAEHLQNAG